MNGLSALRAASFDWVMRLDDVWRDSSYDVPELNGVLRNSILDRLSTLEETSPLGWVILGPAGSGKTHLLGSLRRTAMRLPSYFILADLTDVKDFFTTVLLGYLNSLREPEDAPQGRAVITGLFRYLGQTQETAEENARRLASMNLKSLVKNTEVVLEALARRHRNQTIEHQDVFRSLVLLNSEGFALSNLGYAWLQGLGLEGAEARRVNLKKPREEAINILRGLSWFMGLSAPTLLAIDQLDALVSEKRLSSTLSTGDDKGEHAAARVMIESMSRGLSALPDYTTRTLCLVSCLEATWDILGQTALKSTIDRFEQPRMMFPFNGPDLAARMIERRLDMAFKASGIKPQYPTWPFSPKSFEDASGLTPRELLRRCEAHRRRCLENGYVFEAESLALDEGPEARRTSSVPFLKIDSLFAKLKEKAPYDSLVSDLGENKLGRLIQTACRLLLKETSLPGHIDMVIETRFGGGKTHPPLHARVSLVNTTPGAEETHVCFRALTRSNPKAFLARLRAALTASGIDRYISFRRLFILRASPIPEGPKCLETVDQLLHAGGRIIEAGKQDVAALWALDVMDGDPPPGFEKWLLSRRPISRVEFIPTAFPELFQSQAGLFSPEEPDQPGFAPSEDSIIPLGRGASPETSGLKVYLPLSALSGHVVVTADKGAGKTVLMRRLMEEAALKGISSVVVDSAAELNGLTQAWPSPPQDWFENDAELARAFKDKVDVRIWTPGVKAEQPIFLAPWPDFNRIPAEVLDDAVNLGVWGLTHLLELEAATKAKKKTLILKAALKYFAQQGGRGFSQLVELLKAPPPGALGRIRGGQELAAEMAFTLAAGIERSSLYSKSMFTKPEELFKSPAGSPRISVLNLSGLMSLPQRRAFAACLISAVFTVMMDAENPWKKGVSGILAFDEAKEFFPAADSPACKSGLQRLFASGVSRGLAVMMAADSPMDLDQTVFSLASTSFYGKFDAAAGGRKIRKYLTEKGGRNLNPAKLDVGRFFVWSEKHITPPVLIETPMCLTHHPEETV